MEALRIAVIGCGKMGREHARACRAVGARVVAVVDPEAARAEELAAAHPSCAAVASIEALPWGSLSAVFVCTPPFARGPAERLAIQAGVPFFAEKPVGLDAPRAEPLLRALADRPVVHAVGYMNRQRASVRRARERLAGEALVGLCGWWVGKPYGRPWWLDTERSGGPFNEQGTHLVDLCRVLAGDVFAVTALGRPSPGHPGANDSVAVALELRAGACATLFYCCRATDRHVGLEAFTTRSAVRLTGWELALATDGEDPGEVEPAERLFERQAEAFLDAVATRTQRPDLCTFADAVQTQRVVDAIGRAVRSGARELV